ncbi:MAG: MgtC/SapB family protein [Candidatus Bathyarchaeota archaeon]|nr:MgtC/SapB family protein [Candidatus Bathyarchaeota archaeon]
MQNFYSYERIFFVMQTVLTLETFLNLLLAVALGAIVGIERELTHKPAGLRTHMLVSLGACLFTIVSVSFAVDPARIASGIVAGIGFIGAGTIWGEKDKVKGITTAASLWATAAIGLTTGIGDYPLAAVVTAVVVIILASGSALRKLGLEKD